MERESFEDQDVAEILNRSFISIKVDREERPDIDHMYMTYCQALTGSGGWPLTAILTPDKQPFFAGTYFPKHSQYGRPGLMDILNQVAELWVTDKDRVIATAAELYEAVANGYKEKKNGPLNADKTAGIDLQARAEEDSVFTWGKGVLRKGYAMMEKSFDAKFGGFGNAPKFPSPHNLGFLMRFALEEPQSQALTMAEKTLEQMADGGIYDHIGFGFARYSTDRHWLVPHFEKMLYDNAGLAFVYLEAFQLTKKERFGRVAREIFQYVLRDMTSPEGGFYSAEDADSEGVEGKFYVWDELEVKSILLKGIDAFSQGKERVKNSAPADSRLPRPGLINHKIVEQFLEQKETLANLYCEAYGINEEGNYEGKNIPSKIFSIWEEIAYRHKLKLHELDELLSFCNQILFTERKKRIHPAKDDKILVSWNGLMIAVLAKGAQVFTGRSDLSAERDSYLTAAETAVGFILSRMFDARGRLLARYRDGDAGYPGYLDDYAFLIYGLLEVYMASGKPEYLKEAIRLQEEQERLFKDKVNGGYYFTGNDAEELLLRPKEIYDGAMPSGNSISAYNLARLWRITGDEKWRQLTEQQFATFKATLQDYPPGYTAFLQAIQFYVGAGDEIVLTGPLVSKTIAGMQQVIFQDFRPLSVLTYQEGTLDEIIPRMKDYPVSDRVLAYLCRNFTCREPVGDPGKLNELLRG